MDTILSRLKSVFSQFIMYVPAVQVPSEQLLTPVSTRLLNINQTRFPGDFLMTGFQISTPDTRLIQYDCGKLQVLASLLRKLFTGGHRALIFTQMTKMLDVLEAFLNYHGYVYMRLDGSTKVEVRQALMERFNNDPKYFIFILSTRSGGVGMNLTGADTVIFYDNDWNPTMDAQAQDRCHRIGQTRDVHIYRLISERTVEENILKKANQKRLLGDIAIEGGNFTTAFFKKSTINDLFDSDGGTSADTAEIEDVSEEDPKEGTVANKSLGVFENALATAEDDLDIQASKEAKAEENQDENDFREEEDQFTTILKQMSSVEKYALRHMETIEAEYVQGQLEAADAELEARKEEFDAEKIEELTQEMMGESSGDEEEDEEEDVKDEVIEEEQNDSDDDSDVDSDDYEPVESDDETIDKDEQEEKKDDFEINMLENEAEVPIEELLKMYYPDQLKIIQEGETSTVATEESGTRKTTRSRGAVDVNLWNLENPEERFSSTYNPDK